MKDLIEQQAAVLAEKQEPNTFQREIRYEVRQLKTGKLVDCVVVEADWPEYETVWKMIQDRVDGKKQEPVKDEPVAWCQDTENEITPEFGFSWVKTRLHDVPLYTRPQPDLTAEVERLRREVERMKTVPMKDRRMEFNAQQAQRIAALEEAAQQARDALRNHPSLEVYTKDSRVREAIAKLDAVLHAPG